MFISRCRHTAVYKRARSEKGPRTILIIIGNTIDDDGNDNNNK